MKSETRAKIQEALLEARAVITDTDDIERDLGENDKETRAVFFGAIDKIDSAREALAAEPDEPTVSKSIEELVNQIMEINFLLVDGSVMIKRRDDSAVLIQLFLDAKIAERDNKIKELESENKKLESICYGKIKHPDSPREYTDDELLDMSR